MKKRIHFIYLLLISLLLSQCQTSQIGSIKKAMTKSIADEYVQKSSDFKKSRELLFKILDTPEMNKNDSIIILERYRHVPSFTYFCTIYESGNQVERSYRMIINIKNRTTSIDSLVISSGKNFIIPLVLNNRFEEIEERASNTWASPTSSIKINILTKRGKNKFNIKTIDTTTFYPTLEEEKRMRE